MCNLNQDDSKLIFIRTYVVDAINKWIVTAIRHGEPITAKEYDIYVSIPDNMYANINNFQIAKLVK